MGQLELPEEVPLGLKRRGRKPKTLGLNQKLEIVHRVLVGGESQSDLAKDFRVSQSLISNLVTKVRKKPELLRELISKRAEKQLGDLELADFIEDRMKQGVQIRTVKQTSEDYETASGISLK